MSSVLVPAESAAPVGAAQHPGVRRNNIDLLRLLLAFYVVYAHCRILSGASEQFPSLKIPVDAAVQGFFVLSGYLIFKSFDASASTPQYLWKRFRRIYPPYVLIVLGAGLLLGFTSAIPLGKYYGIGLIKYLGANLIFLNFLHPDLPGVFVGNPVTNAVNGALWTIKVEVLFYASVPIFANLIRGDRRKKLLMLSGMYVTSCLYTYALRHFHDGSSSAIYELLEKQMPGQLRFFTVGAAVYFLRLEKSALIRVAGVSAAIVLVLRGMSDDVVLYPLLIGAIVLCGAFLPSILDISRVGDISYGVYLIHFPVVQLFVYYGAFRVSLGAATAGVFAVVSLLACASWRFVEQPCLKWRLGRPLRPPADTPTFGELAASTKFVGGGSGIREPRA